MAKRKSITTALALAALVAAAVGGYFWLNQPAQQTNSSSASGRPLGSGAIPAAGAAGPASGPRPAGVEVAKIEKASLQDDAQSVGTLKSKQNVMLRPEVAGRIVYLGFADGQRVRRGQLLVQLDDVLQRAEVKQSQAQVSIALANLKRNQELVAQNFVAQRVLDESGAALQVAQAQLSLSCARLTRMRVEAPFSGTVGIRTISLGDYVKDGADLVNLEDLSSMWADFRLPERFQNKVRKGQTVELQIDAFPGRLFKAEIEAVDPALDVNARSIAIRAALANTAGEPIAARGVADQRSTGGAAGRPPAAGPGATLPASARRPAASAAVGSQGSPTTDASREPAASEEWVACRAHDRPTTRSTVAAGTASGTVQARGSEGGGGPLRPGMFVRATAVFGIKDNALIVPEEAIVPQGGRQFVIKAVDRSVIPGTATAALAPEITQVSQRVEVRIGVRRPGRVEVTAAGPVGISEGDTVVTAGQQRLQRDGTGLRIVELGRPGTGAAAAAAQSSSTSTVASPAALVASVGAAGTR